nr:MAG TPA: hypothetical protein [Caudoviricetes sp.]
MVPTTHDDLVLRNPLFRSPGTFPAFHVPSPGVSVPSSVPPLVVRAKDT